MDIFIAPKAPLKGKSTDKDSEDLQEKISKFASHSKVRSIFNVIIAPAIAIASYFIIRYFLPEDMAIWLKELASLILSLLILGGLSAASDGDSDNISVSVVILLIAIFIWQLVAAYGSHDFSRKSEVKVEQACQSRYITTLYPNSEPYVFHLPNIGDETPWFRNPDGGKFLSSFSSRDYGYEIIYNNGDIIQGGPNINLPVRRNPIMKIRAVSPNQFVHIKVSHN